MPRSRGWYPRGLVLPGALPAWFGLAAGPGWRACLELTDDVWAGG